MVGDCIKNVTLYSFGCLNFRAIYRYLALESMCLLATSEFSHEAVKKHQETVVTALKVLCSSPLVYTESRNFVTKIDKK